MRFAGDHRSCFAVCQFDSSLLLLFGRGGYDVRTGRNFKKLIRYSRVLSNFKALSSLFLATLGGGRPNCKWMLLTDSILSPLFLKMTTRKRRTIYPPSRAFLLLLLLLGTCQTISADRHAKSVRGEALRRSVLDIYSFDFFASKKGKKGGMKAKKAGKKDKKDGKKAPKKSLKLGKEKGKGMGMGMGMSKGKGKGKGALVPTRAPSVSSPPSNPTPGSPTRAPLAPGETPFPTPTSPTVSSLAPTGKSLGNWQVSEKQTSITLTRATFHIQVLPRSPKDSMLLLFSWHHILCSIRSISLISLSPGKSLR
jgi:hypothetical protein